MTRAGCLMLMKVGFSYALKLKKCWLHERKLESSFL
nr:unnamed protein product [Callosobruchus analis]